MLRPFLVSYPEHDRLFMVICARLEPSQDDEAEPRKLSYHPRVQER